MKQKGMLPAIPFLLALVLLPPGHSAGETTPRLQEVHFQLTDTAAIDEATLYVDGKISGLVRKEPPLVRHLTLGDHRIELFAFVAGQLWFRDKSTYVIAGAGPTVDVLHPAKMTALQRGAAGTLGNAGFRLDTRCAAQNARLSVDGNFCGILAKDSTLTLCLRGGRHAVTARAISAGQAYEKTLLVEIPNGSRALSFVLNPAARN